MKKITLPDFERNHVKKSSRWNKILLVCVMLLFGPLTMMYGQIAGETCVNSFPITALPFSHTGNTATYGNNYTLNDVPPVAPGAITTGSGSNYYLDGFDVVYSITPIISGQVSISTTNNDAWVSLWAFSGCPFTSTVGYHVSTSGTTRTVNNLPVVANVTYYFVISNWNPEDVAYTINITGTDGLLTPLEGCTGVPTAGTASMTPNSGNAGASIMLNSTGVTSASGLVYQWQKSIAGSWTDIAGATSMNSAVIAESGAVGTVTDYRLKVTCTASAEVAYSNTVSYSIVLSYCVPTGNGNNSDEIRNFTLSNLNHSTPASEGIAGYSNYSGTVAPAQLSISVPYIASVLGGAGSGNHGAAIWIDYNQNGTFEDSEKVAFIGSTITANSTGNFPEFVVPTGTALGIYRLRVQYHYNKSGELLVPCDATSTYSETEDYSVEVMPVPTCVQPSGLAALEITSTSADLSWTSTGSAFIIEWGLQGFTPGTGTTVNVTGNSYVLTGLASNTAYSYYVRTDCGTTDGLSLWTGPLNFKTACGSVDSFFENFDSYTSTGSLNPLPACWERAGNGTSYITTGSVAPNSPANRLYLSANGIATTPTVAYAIMPAVSNLQAQSHRLKFKAYAATANKTMEIGYFTELTDLSSFVLIETINLPGTSAATTEEFSVEPSGIPAGVTNLVFRNNAPTSSLTIYIDDVAWEALPLCPDITSIETQTFNSSTATISWEPGGSETDWEYVYGPAATTTSPEGLTPVAVSNNPTLTLSSLTGNTTYNVWIRSTCAAGEGNWPQNPFKFTTSCAPVDSFNENFDTYTLTGSSNPLPTCWTRSGNTANTYITTGSTAPMSPSNRLYLSASATGASLDAIAVMPPVSNLQAGTHRLRFKAFATSTGKSLELGYYEYAGDADSFVVIEAFELPGTVVANTQDFNYTPEYIPAGIESLVFRNHGPAFTGTTTMYIDNVVWEPLPACFDITEIVFNNIGATTADVEWNPGGSETAWQYAYAPSTTTSPEGLTPVDVVNNPFVTISGLTSSTNYNLWVRSNCGNGTFGNWSTVKTFLTACAPVTTLPWMEGFEGLTTVGTTAFPPCWSKQIGDWSTAIASSYNLPKSGTKYLRTNWSATNDTMWTPGFELTAGTSYDFSFFMQGDGFQGWTVDVLQNTQQNSENAIEIGDTVTANGTGTIGVQAYQLVSNTFTVDADGVYYFAIRVNQPSGSPWYLAFDDFKMEVTPTCIAPTVQPVTNVTATTATISWSTTQAPANGFEYYVTTDSAFVPNASTVPTGSTSASVSEANITGLMGSTTYYFFVKSLCGTGDLSTWSTAGSFTTPCVAISTLPWNEGFEGVTAVGTTGFPPCWFKENGDWATALASTYNTPRTGTKYLRDSWTATNEYMWTPGFELTANTSYDFSFYMQGDGNTGWNIDVFQNTTQLSTGATQLGSTSVANGAGSTLMQSYQLVNRTFVPTTTGVYYFAVRVNQASGSPWYVAFDDFNLKLSPNCVPPTVMPITNITTTTATANWSAPLNAPANGYEYYATTSATIPTAATTPTGSVTAGVTTLELTGLANSSNYKFYVRSVCDATDTSEWSQAVSFTTLCDAAPLPYFIDFENATVPNLPLCTVNQNVGTGNDWKTFSGTNSGFTGKFLRYTYNSSNAADTWFFTNTLNLVAGTTYSVSYKYGAGSTSYTEKLKVAYGTAANNAAMTTILADHNNVNFNVPQNNTVDFTPATSGSYVIGFNAYSPANGLYLQLDNILIQEALGTNDFDSNNFVAYPNPVKDKLTIRYNQNISDVTVFNLLGQQLFSNSINATEGKIDMSSLASGNYLVKVTSGDKVQTIKVIKE